MALSELQVRAAKPRDRDYKLSDARGLYLLVRPNGSKLWRFKYRYLNVEKKLSLGAFPDVTLKAARRQCDLARHKLADGIDPSREKRIAKIAAKLGAETRFEAIAEEFISKREQDGLHELTLRMLSWVVCMELKAVDIPILDRTEPPLQCGQRVWQGRALQ